MKAAAEAPERSSKLGSGLSGAAARARRRAARLPCVQAERSDVQGSCEAERVGYLWSVVQSASREVGKRSHPGASSGATSGAWRHTKSGSPERASRWGEAL